METKIKELGKQKGMSRRELSKNRNKRKDIRKL